MRITSIFADVGVVPLPNVFIWLVLTLPVICNTNVSPVLNVDPPNDVIPGSCPSNGPIPTALCDPGTSVPFFVMRNDIVLAPAISAVLLLTAPYSALYVPVLPHVYVDVPGVCVHPDIITSFEKFTPWNVPGVVIVCVVVSYASM
jgi:hypothetical protein